ERAHLGARGDPVRVRPRAAALPRVTFDAFTALMYAPHVQTSRPTVVVSLTRCVTCSATTRSLVAFCGVKTVRTALIGHRAAGRGVVQPVVPLHVKSLGWYDPLRRRSARRGPGPWPPGPRPSRRRSPARPSGP